MSNEDYSHVAHAFIELRGRGLSLSSADLTHLRSWRDLGIPPLALLEFLFSLADECESAGKGFPLTLKAVDVRLKRALRSGQLARWFDAAVSANATPGEPT
jgi:hypothetical protein